MTPSDLRVHVTQLVGACPLNWARVQIGDPDE